MAGGSVGLQIKQDERFQRREWKAVRLGWALIAAIVLAALAGLLGPGPMSWTSGRGGEGLVEVEYQRFTHLEADDLMTVTVDGDAAADDTVEILLGQEWVEAVTITGISPQPSDERVTPQGLVLTIPTEPGADVPVQLMFRASDIGTTDGVVEVSGDRVAFSQFVYA